MRTAPKIPQLRGARTSEARARRPHDPQVPTVVEFGFEALSTDSTYVEIIETGFSGDGDTLVDRVISSTQGFTFLLSSMKAYLEHDLILHITEDAHPDRRVA